MRSLVSSRPFMALTLCLMLVTIQMGESHMNLFGMKLGTLKMFKPKSRSPSPAPAPAPGPSNARRNVHRRPKGDFDTSPGDAVGLQIGFYDGLCNDVDVEEIIAAKTQEEFENDPTLLPALLRMQFHDCFVHGCDASILIDGTSTEKNASSNGSVRGYEFIELVKLALEEECPGVVSCADIIAVATKELIRLGGGVDYPVQTGRRDGLVSRAQDVQLPTPDMTASQAAAVFAAKNFSPEDMVILLGAHSVGVAHCNFFQGRLTPNSGEFDANIEPNLGRQLTTTCQRGGPGATTRLNQDLANNNTLDNTFYGQLLDRRGVLAVDQDLSRNPETRPIVLELDSNNDLFSAKFANAMIKLQALDVLVGDEGEIRTICSSR